MKGGASLIVRLICVAAVLLANPISRSLAGAPVQPMLLLRVGLVETVSHGPVRGAVLIANGRIVAVGPNLTPPAGARVRDFPSAILTPGFVESASGVGLTEIEMERATVDIQGAGTDDPVRAAFRTADAFHAASPVIPIARSGGVTSVVSMPTGGLVAGRSLWADLNERPRGDQPATRHARILSEELSLNITLGERSARLLGGSRGIAFLRLRELFEDAELYAREPERFRENRLRRLGASPADLRALSTTRSEKRPVVMYADRADDIERAVGLAGEFDLNLVILGGAEAHVVAPLLARTKTPVVLNSLESGPDGFDRLRASPENAARLFKAGVPVILSTLDAFDFRHRAHLLRLIAGNAIRFGLPREAALRAVTLQPAHAFGMSSSHGSIQKGRVANLVVWSGDPFEISSHPLAVFVDGIEVSLDSRQRRLLEKYRRVP